MSHPAATYEDAAQLIGVLPTLEPRPTATNIRTLVVDLVNKLISVPSQQSADHGYAGMVEQNELYKLRTVKTNPVKLSIEEIGHRSCENSNFE